MFSSSLVFQQHFRFPLEFLPVVLFGVRIDFFIVSLSMTFCSIFCLAFVQDLFGCIATFFFFFDFFIKLLTTSCCWSIHNSINYFYIYSFFLWIFTLQEFFWFLGRDECFIWFIPLLILNVHFGFYGFMFTFKDFFRKDGWQVSIFFVCRDIFCKGRVYFGFYFPLLSSSFRPCSVNCIVDFFSTWAKSVCIYTIFLVRLKLIQQLILNGFFM